MSLSIHTRVSIFVLALFVLFSFTETLAQQSDPGRPYASEKDLIEVMFAQDSRVRMREGVLVDLDTNALQGLAEALADAAPTTWSRICEVEEDVLDQLQARGEAETGESLYNLNNIYRLRFTPGEGTPDVWSLSERLEALPGVLVARPVPLPMPPPLPPDFMPAQGYLFPAGSTPTGIDAQYAWTMPGGDGTGITICDIEYSWNANHDDLTKAPGKQINSFVQDPFFDNNHGTAVLGEMISDDNAPNWGTKGICPAASAYVSGSYFGYPLPSWNPAGAIAVALAYLKPGDVVLLEQQWDYTGSGGYVPIEWWMSTTPNPQFMNAVYVAIQTASANNIYVVEAGGNGGIDTDLMTWIADSRAFIVGAGGAYPGGTYPEGDLERLSFSSYGNRFNLQGWGEDVVTTGYGDLYNLEGVNRLYTNTFAGTSSASPMVAGAITCCAGYQRANISMTPLPPNAMRNLLMVTGTPQVFGPAGNIGPRPDLLQAINAMGGVTYDGDWGDAPEFAIAYPSTGIMGFFPTCSMTGPPGSYVLHRGMPPFQAYFGPMEEYEIDGNAGNCPNFPPYDADECFRDGDAGLLIPGAFTIQGGLEVPCGPYVMPMGMICTPMNWGAHIEIDLTNASPTTVFVNVLMDWDQNGMWAGTSWCPPGQPAPEHVLVNFPVPPGFSGPISLLGPPPFLSGPNPGFIWSRFSVTDIPVVQDWDGSGDFMLGETEDYLLRISEEPYFEGEYGDAPEGALAYPATAVIGAFPTCYGSGPSGYVIHGLIDGYPAMFGNSLDWEPEGNAGNCPNFPPYDADECFQDGDAGLMMPPAYTIQGGVVVPCAGVTGSLGMTCQAGVWGTNIDIWVDNNNAVANAYVNILFDWNQDGRWNGFGQCPGGAAPEHVLWNFLVPQGYVGPLSGLNPPAFMIGRYSGYVWARFTISYTQLPFDWNGHWVFQGGETEDYLIEITGQQEEYGEYGDAPEGAIAYPTLGINGQFPTCAGVGPAGFVYHQPMGTTFFGPSVDFEFEGNANNCPNFPPYDADECFNDPDAGLLFPPAYTIDNALNVVPCDPTAVGPLGIFCTTANWGGNIDILVTNNMPMDAYVNVLMDWDQNGQWQGASQCPMGPAPEHVLVNLIVPAGYSGPLSALGPLPFLIGPNVGFVWTRFTVSERPVGSDWDGSGFFENGETCDYLLEVIGISGEDFGDAPEGATAYPALGVMGQFPTCVAVGPAGFVRHTPFGNLYFGGLVDNEADGNAGNCIFPPYDQDECGSWLDPDPGLSIAVPFTINAAMNVVPCPGIAPNPFATTCQTAPWGTNVDIAVTNLTAADAYVNVLMDWNQNGAWQGASQCPTGPAPEHVLVNFVVPAGFSGLLSNLNPLPFLVGPNTGYIWTRFTVSDMPVVTDWDGSGNFGDGESEDYLLAVTQEDAEYGDAPEGSIAYPDMGTVGFFPTCRTVPPSGFVVHALANGPWFGPLQPDGEPDGNAGNCPNFPPYDADECFNDGDAGLLQPPARTIDPLMNYRPCMPGMTAPLGYACSTAVWGIDIELDVHNPLGSPAFVNVLMDWNRNGRWGMASQCPNGPAPEHVLVDFQVPPGFNGPLGVLGPPPFVIGPDTTYVWTRFTISERPVGPGWNGEGAFEMGETEDYLLYVRGIDLSDVRNTDLYPIQGTRILTCRPNPFSRSTTVFFEVDRLQEVEVSVCDVSGRHVRALRAGATDAGRYEAVWHGDTDDGRPVAAGVYFLRLRAQQVHQSRPIILLD